jgi:hypothetical protein
VPENAQPRGARRVAVALAGFGLGAGLLALALATCPRGSLGERLAAPKPPTRTASMDDKVLIATGWTVQELEAILRAFREMYEERLGPAFSAEIVSSDGVLRVTFPAGIEPMEFAFLVNYVHYPKGFDLRARHILAAGRVTLTERFNLPDRALVGQKAMVYVPRNDREYDLVYVRTDADATFEDSFASSRWKPVRDPRLPDGIDRLR